MERISADESLMGPPSALEIAAQRAADGVSTKLATCGGLGCARQIDAIAHAARLSTKESVARLGQVLTLY